MRKKVIHSKRKMTIPMGIVAGLAPGVLDVVKNGSANGWGAGGNSGSATALGDFFGIQTPDAQTLYKTKAFSTWRLQYGLYPAIAGFVAHYAASKLGINRMIARAGIPLIRI